MNFTKQISTSIELTENVEDLFMTCLVEDNKLAEHLLEAKDFIKFTGQNGLHFDRLL